MAQKKRSFISIFGYDITHHFLYTLFIVIITVLTTVVVKSRVVTPTYSQEHYENFNLEKTTEPRTSAFIDKQSGVVYHGSRDKKQIALTFDADMTEGMEHALKIGTLKNSYDSRIIDTLNKTHTKATIFLTGMWIETYPDITKELAKNPLFEFGSHSYSHSSYHGDCYGLKKLPQTLKIEDIGTPQKLIRDYVGVENKLFRFPGGCYSSEDVQLVRESGDTVIDWDVVSGDAFNSNTEEIIHNVLTRTQNGSIIVMHLNGAPTAPKTAEALPEIIKELKAKGFEFVKVSELLRD